MPKKRQLIINADGFGFGPGATRGVQEAILQGKGITSVSINTNFPEVESLLALLQQRPEISVGVHVNPYAGKPLLPPDEVESLVNDAGELLHREFLGRWKKGRIKRIHLEKELSAQIERAIDLAGKNLTHIDSQGNSHLHYLGVFQNLASKYQIRCTRTNAPAICLESLNPIRCKIKTYLRFPHLFAGYQLRKMQMRRLRRSGLQMADRLVTIGYAGNGNKTEIGNWARVFRALPMGISEIYCHPGYSDSTLTKYAFYYREQREQELDLFKSGKIQEMADAAGVELVSFFSLI